MGLCGRPRERWRRFGNDIVLGTRIAALVFLPASMGPRMRPMSTCRAATFIASLTILPGLGCYSTWDINPASLRHLDGFHKGEDRELTTNDGEQVPFSSDTALNIRMRDGSYVQGFRMRSVNIEEGRLVATEDGVGRVRQLAIEISNVAYVKAEGPDGKKTAGSVAATTAIVLGIGALAGLTILGLYSAVPVR